jgi:hypothetical protein
LQPFYHLKPDFKEKIMQSAVKLETAVPDCYHQFKQARKPHRPDGLVRHDYYEVADALRAAAPDSEFSQKYPDNKELFSGFADYTTAFDSEDAVYSDEMDHFMDANFYSAIEKLDRDEKFVFDQKMYRGLGKKSLYDPELIAKRKSEKNNLVDIQAQIAQRIRDNSAQNDFPDKNGVFTKRASAASMSLKHRENAASLFNISNKTDTMTADQVEKHPKIMEAYDKIKDALSDESGNAVKTPMSHWNELLAQKKQQKEAEEQLERMGGGVSKKKENSSNEKEHFLMSTFKDAIFICQTVAATIQNAAVANADDDNQRITAPTPAPGMGGPR